MQIPCRQGEPLGLSEVATYDSGQHKEIKRDEGEATCREAELGELVEGMQQNEY